MVTSYILATELPGFDDFAIAQGIEFHALMSAENILYARDRVHCAHDCSIFCGRLQGEDRYQEQGEHQTYQ